MLSHLRLGRLGAAQWQRRCPFYLGFSEAGRRKSFKDVKFDKRRKRWAF